MITVHQYLPSLIDRDAVSNHALGMHRALQAAGMGAHIWTETVDSSLRSMPLHLISDGFTPADRDRRVHLYQSYVGSTNLTDLLLKHDEPLSVYYHNITPASHVIAYDPAAAELMDGGRDELARLASRVRIGLAGSHFSAEEVRALGVLDVRLLLPYAPELPLLDSDLAYERWLRDSKAGMDVLFVGRVAPHKGHRHLLRMMAFLRAGAERPVRLFVVGSPGPEPYMFAVTGLRQRLGLEGVVIFTGSLTQRQLSAHYRVADMFVCMSEHEGFCIPLLEAMRAGVPVVAYAAGAVPETLGGTGVLLGSPDPLVAAEMVARVARDETLRRQLIARQRVRARELDRFDRDGVLVNAVRDLAEV